MNVNKRDDLDYEKCTTIIMNSTLIVLRLFNNASFLQFSTKSIKNNSAALVVAITDSY